MLKDHPVQHSMNIPQDLGTDVSSPQLKSFLITWSIFISSTRGFFRVEDK